MRIPLTRLYLRSIRLLPREKAFQMLAAFSTAANNLKNQKRIAEAILFYQIDFLCLYGNCKNFNIMYIHIITCFNIHGRSILTCYKIIPYAIHCR